MVLFVSVTALATVLPSPAHAQSARASFFLQMLRQNPDARVRLSAALRLGELREADTVEPLIQIYANERDPTVLAAIISALASIGDARALPTVQSATRHPHQAVRAQALRAMPILQAAARANVGETRANASPANGTGGPPRFLITVGTVHNQSGVRGAQLSQIAQQAMQNALQQRPQVRLHTGSVAAAQAILRRERLRGHQFDANIQSVQPRGDGVRAQVSIIVSTYPGRVYEFESSTAITITGGSANTPEAADDAVRRAIESAAHRAVDQLNATP